MGLTAHRLRSVVKLVDDVIPEPLGGAHRDSQGDGRRARSRCR
jgi:acetyl-CoA carboxylase alpha subunit